MKHPKTDMDKISLPGVLDVIRNKQGVSHCEIEKLLWTMNTSSSDLYYFPIMDMTLTTILIL